MSEDRDDRVLEVLKALAEARNAESAQNHYTGLDREIGVLMAVSRVFRVEVEKELGITLTSDQAQALERLTSTYTNYVEGVVKALGSFGGPFTPPTGSPYEYP